MGQMDAAAAVVAFVYENIFSNIIRAFSFFILRGLNAWNNSISISAAIRSSIPSSGRSAKPEIGRRRKRFISEGYDSLADGHAGLLWCFGACK